MELGNLTEFLVKSLVKNPDMVSVKAFDDELSKLGMVPMNMTEFATLSVVLSERQMRLQVRQLFNIVHSPLDDNLTFK